MMSNKEFLELLNLYIDEEISAEERDRLEREIAVNESRRAVFNEYVRLQEATEKLFNHFHSSLTETVDLKKYHILARDSDQRYVMGSLYSAAAVFVACLSIFAATRILSDQSGMGVAQTDLENGVRYGVEVVRNAAAERDDLNHVWPISRENQLPPSSDLQSIFTGYAESASAFRLRSEGEPFYDSRGNRIYQSSNSFKSPPPDMVSFQFQR